LSFYSIQYFKIGASQNSIIIITLYFWVKIYFSFIISLITYRKYMHEEKVISDEIAQHPTAQMNRVSEESDDISEVIQYLLPSNLWIAI